MSVKRILQIAVMLMLNVIVILYFINIEQVSASVYQVGASGEDIKTVQTKLKRWGYYTGEVDGIFGSKMEEAVESFQKANGLKVDGVIGPEVKKALGISSGEDTDNKNQPSSSRDNDFYLLSRIITAEAQGEPYTGQVAVGAVILNRVDHPSFPSSVAGVIYQNGAFSPIANGEFDRVTITESARKAAQDCLNGSDPTGGAIYFYNPDKSTSKWILSRETVLVIGDHVFAK